MQWRRAVPYFLFLAVFAVYAYTAYPTVAPRDSADLAAAALTFTPAHPPGYPLYVLLGKAWLILLPWGDPAYRLNLLSAAAGAGCATAVFLLLARCCGLWAALAGALALAFSAPLWKFSLLCEMYSLHGLFLALLFLLAPGPRQDESSWRRRAAWSAGLLGLALVNHQAFVLAAPALAALWWRQMSGSPGRRLLGRVCLPLFFLGLSLYAFLWLRTGSLQQAWAIATRQEYGTWQLSSTFSRPLSLELAWGLLSHLAAELWRAASPVVFILAVIGAWELRRGERRFAWGLALAFLTFGPGFFLMTRFDLQGWVARTVLESTLLAPTIILCVTAGFGVTALGRKRRLAAAGAALAAIIGSLWSNAARCYHRDDFCAYDYIKDIRRALPPGSTTVAGGDTALYAWRYFDLAHPDGKRRRLINYQDGLAAVRPDFALGVSLENLARLGLTSDKLSPAGLALAVSSAPGGEDFWDFSVLRQGHALRNRESYARDVILSYAFAHYASAVLYESRRDGRGAPHYLQAAALDPEDFHIEYNRAP